MDNKIIDYIILSENSGQALANAVNIKINQGWQPYGNITSTNQGESIWIIQAMVKYSK
jgi:hypothetical protein